MQIKLSEEEKLTLQYRVYEADGAKIAVDQFVYSDREYNEEHYKRMMDTYSEKYRARQECLFGILKNHNVSIPVKNYDFMINEDTLVVR